MTVVEALYLRRINESYRRTREPVRTAVLAQLTGQHERQVRDVLKRLRQRGAVERIGQRGGWLPAGARRAEAGMGHQKSRRRPRKDEALEFICRFASENCGATPNSREISRALGLSQSRVQQLMMRLQLDGRIAYVDRYTYRVEQSVWEPPPYVRI